MRLYPPVLHHLLWRNCQIKAAVVTQDERESGLRAILNLGHTFAHALETCAGYQHLSHGEAVSIGMAAAGRMARNLGLFSEAGFARLINLLECYHLPTHIPQEIPAASIMTAMKSDKKARHGRLRFVLPERIGKVRIVSEVAASAVRQALSQGKEPVVRAGNRKSRRA
jgi:3-dehydroquinate synthase